MTSGRTFGAVHLARSQYRDANGRKGRLSALWLDLSGPYHVHGQAQGDALIAGLIRG